MNEWGIAECKVRRDEIRQWISAGASQTGWMRKAKAVALAIAQGLFIDPLDPAGWLVDEAIRRAEENAAKACCETE